MKAATDTFGQALQRRRKALDLTQEALGARAGCTGETIRAFEAGRRRPSRQLAERLAACLELEGDVHAAFVALARTRERPLDSSALAPAAPHLYVRLPAPVNRFVGREQERAELAALLAEPMSRLITITGAGGTGKTRLAVEVAASVAGHWKDGVAFVALAPIHDPDLVASTIADALGIPEMAGQTIGERLVTVLRERQMLLLLDNFEQVVSGATIIAPLLAAAPRLKVLATSRGPLQLYGECEFPLQPLALPTPATGVPGAMDAVIGSDAVELFVERARTARPGFVLTPANTATIGEICRRLDGLPLAIELAAARIRFATPQALLERLGRRLDILVGGARDLPERQQTIRATIAWSYDLCAPPAREVFRALGVFVGGCSLDAAAHVARSNMPETGTVIDEEIRNLVDHALLFVHHPEDGAERYSMLELIREYALEQAGQLGEVAALRDRHAAYFLDLARTAEKNLRGPEQAAALQQFETEHDNIRSALVWALEDGHVELAVQLATAIWQFADMRGYFSEGRLLLDKTLAAAGSHMPGIARVLLGAGSLAMQQADYARASTLLEEAVAEARRAGDHTIAAEGLLALGGISESQSDIVRARALCEQGLGIFQDRGDKAGVARALASLGHVARLEGNIPQAMQLWERSLGIQQAIGNEWESALLRMFLGTSAGELGDIQRACEMLDQSLALHRKFGNMDAIVWTLNSLGQVALAMNDVVDAEAMAREGLEIASSLGIHDAVASLQNLLGHVELARGKPNEAAALFKQGLRGFLRIREPRRIATNIEELALVAARQGRLHHAARMLGAAHAIRTRHNIHLAPVDQASHDDAIRVIRSRLDNQAWADAWADGLAQSLEEAAADALEDRA